MFEPFSSGYYLGRLYVRPHGGDRTVMHEAAHERVNEQLYADGEGIERLDRPLLVKLGTVHLPVHGEAGVPERTLAVPEDDLASTGVDNPPTLSPVLLAKRRVADRLLGPAAGV